MILESKFAPTPHTEFLMQKFGIDQMRISSSKSEIQGIFDNATQQELEMQLAECVKQLDDYYRIYKARNVQQQDNETEPLKLTSIIARRALIHEKLLQYRMQDIPPERDEVDLRGNEEVSESILNLTRQITILSLTRFLQDEGKPVNLNQSKILPNIQSIEKKINAASLSLDKESLETLDKRAREIDSDIESMRVKLRDSQQKKSTCLKNLNQHLENNVSREERWEGFCRGYKTIYFIKRRFYHAVIDLMNQIVILDNYIKKNQDHNFLVRGFNHLQTQILEKETAQKRAANFAEHEVKHQENVDNFRSKQEEIAAKQKEWIGLSEQKKCDLLKAYAESLYQHNARIENSSVADIQPWQNLVVKKFAIADEIYSEFKINFRINHQHQMELIGSVRSVFGTTIVEADVKNFEGLTNPMQERVPMKTLKDVNNWVISETKNGVVFIFVANN